MVRISIITPTFNRVHFLSVLWQSLLAQTITDWEWILVDDGSIDNTNAWAHTILDKRLRYYFQPNQGKSVARNYGLSQSLAPYVLFVDSDDWLFPNALETHCQFLDQHPEFDLCISDGIYVNADGKEICKLSDRRRFLPKLSLVEAYVRDAALIGAIHCVGLRRLSIQSLFPVGMSMGEDWLFFIRSLRQSQVGWVKEITCAYVWHSENDTLSKNRGSLMLDTYQYLITQDWFNTFSEETRMIVLQKMILELAKFDFEKQWSLLNTIAQMGFSNFVRIKLERRVALQWLMEADWFKVQMARSVLRRAIAFDLTNKKSLIALGISYLPTSLRRWLIRWWIDGHRQRTVTDPLTEYLEFE